MDGMAQRPACGCTPQPQASAALIKNQGIATTGDSVTDGFPSLLIMRTETEKDRLRVHTKKEIEIQIQITKKGRGGWATKRIKKIGEALFSGY
jgi:hypothetical protein